jgi:hypothetical protein
MHAEPLYPLKFVRYRSPIMLNSSILVPNTIQTATALLLLRAGIAHLGSREDLKRALWEHGQLRPPVTTVIACVLGPIEVAVAAGGTLALVWPGLRMVSAISIVVIMAAFSTYLWLLPPDAAVLDCGCAQAVGDVVAVSRVRTSGLLAFALVVLVTWFVAGPAGERRQGYEEQLVALALGVIGAFATTAASAAWSIVVRREAALLEAHGMRVVADRSRRGGPAVQ